MFGTSIAWMLWLQAATPTAVAKPVGLEGHWLSVELRGSGGDRGAALDELSLDLEDRPPRDGRVQGHRLGILRDPTAVLGWIEAHGFSELVGDAGASIRETNAPAPGGPVYERHGQYLEAFIVTRSTADGDAAPEKWPIDPAPLLPPGSQLRIADVISASAPLFAAPAARLPPASERSGTARRSGELLMAGELDRCEGDTPGKRTCLRWVQVIARDGDRFTPGYLPSFLVAPRGAWQHGEARLPRVAILKQGIEDGVAYHHIVARGRDNVLHRTSWTTPAAGGRFPTVSVTVSGDSATLSVDGRLVDRIALDATMAIEHLEARPDGRTDAQPAAVGSNGASSG